MKYRMLPCPTCKRTRRVYTVSANVDHWMQRCSQGHVWYPGKTTLDKVAEMSKRMMLPIVEQLFHRDDVFLSVLNRGH